MNKARIIFGSLIILAAIGGTFAFNGDRFTARFGYTTTVGTFTFRTIVGGPVYTANNVVYCVSSCFATFEPPGYPTFVPTTAVAGVITGTSPIGNTTTTLLINKTCGPSVNIFCTDEF